MKIFSYDIYKDKHLFAYSCFRENDYNIAQKLDGYTEEDCISEGYIKFVEKNQNCFIKVKNDYFRGDGAMTKDRKDEIRELKRDIEILINAYMFGKPLDKKSRNRIAERHFDIIEKQSAKYKLKKASKRLSNRKEM